MESDLAPGDPQLTALVDRKIHAVTTSVSELVHGFEFARLLSAYYHAYVEGDDVTKAKVLRWFRGEYSLKREAKEELGINIIITDDDWYEYLKLFATFFRLAGYAGMMLMIDELVNIYKIPNAITRQYNYEKLLTMYNDTLQGKARYLGILMGATPQALEVLVLCRYIARLLPREGCILFHGSSLSLDGNGVLFTAKSGTGKSTHTRLWREVFGSRVIMVNDDKPFLRVEKDGITVCGTPWRGKHGLGQNICVPLKAVVILCRGEENRIERISPRDALPMLLQQTYSPEEPDMLLKTMALVRQLSCDIPIYRLYCNMDPQAAVTAKNGIFKGDFL